MEQLLALAGGLIVILLGIIGFWIQKWIKSTDACADGGYFGPADSYCNDAG